MLKRIDQWHRTRHMWVPTIVTGSMMVCAVVNAVAVGFNIWQLNCSLFAWSFWVATLTQAHLAKAASVAATTELLRAATMRLRRGGAIDAAWLSWEAQRVCDRAEDPEWYPPLRSRELVERRLAATNEP